ncbi:MAG: class I SAM-dependent methyltransferase [Gammaproteobacteria bacterium]|nr:class I SAM-dependent methyltransferase [Gammaproteobacteria bacterium]
MRRVPYLMCLAFLSQQVLAQPQPQQLTPTQQKIQQVLASDIRTAEEKARDRERNPVATLGFCGISEEMKVLELAPGGGWYTKILGPLLRDQGELHIVEPDYYATRTAPVLSLAGMDKIKKFDWGKPEGAADQGSRGFQPPGKWDEKNFDLVLTFRNYHNFSIPGRALLNKNVHEALKPGGLYCIVDHTRRHMEPDNPENGRRVDPVQLIKEVQQAGFALVDYSRANYRPDDELRFEVGRPTVTGNTDRFTILFKKVENR